MVPASETLKTKNNLRTLIAKCLSPHDLWGRSLPRGTFFFFKCLNFEPAKDGRQVGSLGPGRFWRWPPRPADPPARRRPSAGRRWPPASAQSATSPASSPSPGPTPPSATPPIGRDNRLMIPLFASRLCSSPLVQVGVTFI